MFHDPGKAVDGRRARQAGGRNRPRSVAVLPADTPDHPLADTRDVSNLLADSINQVRCGQLDPKVANTVGYLASVLLRSLEQGRTEEASPNLEDTVAKNPKLSPDFVDDLVARKLSTHQTQPSCGDKDFFYGAEVTYKRLGLIQPNSVKAVANGGAAAAGVAVTGSTFRERFKSMWLIKKEQEMIQSFEAEAGATKSVPNGHDDKGEDSQRSS